MATKGHKPCSEISSNGLQRGFEQLTLCSFYSTKPICRSYRRRVSKRLKASNKPILDEAQFQRALSQLLPRFTAEELANVMAQQDDPLVCLELFNWASQQPRFKHDASTYHIAVKKLGAAEMYEEMDDVVNQVLAISHMGTEALFNTIIYFFTEARKLTRAINIYKHMKNSRNLACRPSIRTYNTLFAAFLSRGNNSYINHVYMDTVRGLFRQMVNDGIEPDIFSLNSMVKGYVLSLHVNDALRIFHQMGVVYNCIPNSFTYDYLIHGLCAQGRTNNAIELCNQMKSKSFIPSGKSYNSLVNALALSGDVEEAIKSPLPDQDSRKGAASQPREMAKDIDIPNCRGVLFDAPNGGCLLFFGISYMPLWNSCIKREVISADILQLIVLRVLFSRLDEEAYVMIITYNDSEVVIEMSVDETHP
ncbi:hypothetical protein G4B88_005320 [Cannabis sativa]|uniref:Pentatricopeptide repeat-containing protein n=1 Tax=Cannabis sativa TaxID=3483 RepID=A0A7J6HBQ4_CANSA|nr:hypothetical protein G4B88_005320 [Cannabis sativa]